MDKKNRKHLLLALAIIVITLGVTAYVLLSGRQKREIVGTWVVDTAGVEQGFQCGADGIAASIYDPWHQYSSWTISGNKLILEGKIFDEHGVYNTTDTLKIKQLNSSSLTIEQNGKETRYKKIR